jgi:GntR family transcriptional regulator
MSAATHIWNEQIPIYRQLRDRLLDLILDGEIPEGDAMPSIRQISLDLRINPLTVTRAVQELELDGALEKRRGLGMFVKPGARLALREQERARFLQEEWPAIAKRIARLELDPTTLLSEVHS